MDRCRQKRNTVEYDHAGGAKRQDAEELIAIGHELRAEVLKWLSEKTAGFCPTHRGEKIKGELLT